MITIEHLEDPILDEGIPLIENDHFLTKVEKKLQKFFKCCQFMDHCFYSSDDEKNFVFHLQTKHTDCKLFCVYCYYSNFECHPTFRSPEELANHIIYCHSFRLFQCSFCLFRAPTITHIHLHQANFHGYQYFSTKNQHSTQLKTCKIIVCKQVVFGPKPDHTVFLQLLKVDKLQSESSKFQCTYCQFNSEDEVFTFQHVCQSHTDYSLCIYNKTIDSLFALDHSFHSFEEKNENEPVLDQIDVSIKVKEENENDPIYLDLEEHDSQINDLEKDKYDKVIDSIPPVQEIIDLISSSDSEDNLSQEDSKLASVSNDDQEKSIDNYKSFQSSKCISNKSALPYSQSNLKPPFSDSVNPNPHFKPLSAFKTRIPMLSNYKAKSTHLKAVANSQSFSSKDTSSSSVKESQNLEKSFERLFALKSVRKAHRPNLIKSFNTSVKPVPQNVTEESKKRKLEINDTTYDHNCDYEDNNNSDDDKKDEGNVEHIGRRPRGYIKNSLCEPFKLAPFSEVPYVERNLFKCILCTNSEPLKENMIKYHLRSCHDAASSTKCGECDFIGSPQEIYEHFAANHLSSLTKNRIVKFIVPYEQDDVDILLSGNASHNKFKMSNSQTARKKTQSTESKNLITNIKNKTFMGPCNWTSSGKTKSACLSSNSNAQTLQKPDNPSNYSRSESKFKTDQLTIAFCIFCEFQEKTSVLVDHIKLHLKLQCSYCSGHFDKNELKYHTSVYHPGCVPKFNSESENKMTKWINDLVNNQFKLAKRYDEMKEEDLNLMVYALCPFCEKVADLNVEPAFRFTSWTSFKKHFWKHCQADFLLCLLCGGKISPNMTRSHLQSVHEMKYFENGIIAKAYLFITLS